MKTKSKYFEHLVYDLIARELKVCPGCVEPKANLSALGADGFDLLNIACALDDELDVTIDEYEALHWLTVRDVVGSVGKAL